MKNLYKTWTPAQLAARTRHQATLMYTQRDITIPKTFRTVTGVLLYRDSHAKISMWDGLHWRSFNQAGWACTFDTPFPHQLKAGHWGIVSPLKRRRSYSFVQHIITDDELVWALTIPEAPVEEQIEEPAEVPVKQTEWISSDAL